MTLNIQQEAEHPEVTALKEKVREVAKRYARRHDWCSVVDDALREMGVEEARPQRINVSIRFTSPMLDGEQETTARFFVRDLVGKSEAEQNAWVAEQIAPTVRLGGASVTIPVTVLDLTHMEPQGLDAVPEGYVAFYTSAEGRVAHLMQTPGAVRRGMVTMTDYLSRHPVYGMCGAGGYGQVEESTRSEGRVCKRCSDRLPSALIIAG